MLADLLDLVRPIAWGAVDMLQRYYRGEQDLQIRKQDSDPVTVADEAVSSYILEQLQQQLDPAEFGYMSEETYQPGPAIPQPYVWIIDPLDGTRDFIEKTGEYAIHIALVHQGRPILALVAWPEADKLYTATLGGGTYRENRQGERQKLQVSAVSDPGQMRLVVSRSHRDQRFDTLLQRLPTQAQTQVGSVGCKIATILEHRAELYPSLTTKSAPKDWDLAAPELILTEAGGQLSHFDLTPLIYNRGDAAQWGGFLASNGQAHAQLCQQIQAVLTELDSQPLDGKP
jgi:3'(2'), 5'-bisphosphate nucleotidase